MSLSLEQIFSRQKAIPLTDAAFVALSEGSLTTTRMSRVRNGTEDFDYKEIAILGHLLTEIEELKRRVAPVPVMWTDVRSVRHLLSDLRKERANPPSPPTPEDWDLLGSFLCGEPAVHMALRLDASVSDVMQRIKTASRRIDSAVKKLADVQQQAAEI